MSAALSDPQSIERQMCLRINTNHHSARDERASKLASLLRPAADGFVASCRPRVVRKRAVRKKDYVE